MLAFRSLDPFRALREPDRRRRDEERLSRSEQRTLSKTQNNHLTGKAPYKFESGFLQRRVCKPSVPLDHHARGGISSNPRRGDADAVLLPEQLTGFDGFGETDDPLRRKHFSS